MEEGLCDSIHILGINPRARRATLVGIPRDSYVPIASGGTNKINVALSQGGPEGMVATVENLTGVTFDYYVLTGFDGMTQIFDALGGLRIDVPYSFEGYEGTDFTEGRTTMTGAETLEYSRTRKSLSHGDFDRSMNQGRDPARGLLAVPGGVPQGSGRALPLDRRGDAQRVHGPPPGRAVHARRSRPGTSDPPGSRTSWRSGASARRAARAS